MIVRGEIQKFINEATSSLEFSEMFTTDVSISELPSPDFSEQEAIEAPNFSANTWYRVGRSLGPSLYPAGFAAYVAMGAPFLASNPIGWAVGAAILVGGIFAANAYFADLRHRREINYREIKDELTYIAYDASGEVNQYVMSSLEKISDCVIQGLEQRKAIVEKKVAIMKHHNSNIDYETAKTAINKLIKGAEVHLAGHVSNNTSGNR